MQMRRVQLFPFILLILVVSGCSHVISKAIRANSDLSLALNQVRENPNAYKGKSVMWGGEIIDVVNQKDGTTEIEVFQRPLNFRGEPKETVASEGRFLVLADRYLDPYVYWRGRKITVAGEITGEKMKHLGEMEYHCPFLISKEIYIWPIYYYRPYPYYYYYPWWGFGWWGVVHFHHGHHH